MPILSHLVDDTAGFVACQTVGGPIGWFYFDQAQGLGILRAHERDPNLQTCIAQIQRSRLPVSGNSLPRFVTGAHVHTICTFIDNAHKYHVDGKACVLPARPSLSSACLPKSMRPEDGILFLFGNPSGNHFLTICYSRHQLRVILLQYMTGALSALKYDLTQMGAAFLPEQTAREMVVVTGPLVEKLCRVQHTIHLQGASAPN